MKFLQHSAHNRFVSYLKILLNVIIGFYLVILVVIIVTGGISFTAFGAKVSATHISNPVIFILLFAFLRLLMEQRIRWFLYSLHSRVSLNKNNGVPLQLIVIFLVSVLARMIISTFQDSPWIWVDELYYARIAKGIYNSFKLTFLNYATIFANYLYPLLLTPTYSLSDISATYGLMKDMNSILMSLVVFPSYLFAREFLSTRAALWVAIFSVLIPSMFYTVTIMTENLFYPIFILSIYLIYKSLISESRHYKWLAGMSMELAFWCKAVGLIIPLIYVATLFIILFYDGFHDGGLRKFPSYFIKGIKPHLVTILSFIVILSIHLSLYKLLLDIPWIELLDYRIILGEGYADQIPTGGELMNIPILSYIKYFIVYSLVLALSLGIIPLLLSVLDVISSFSRDSSRNYFIFTTIYLLGIGMLIFISSRQNLLYDNAFRIHERLFFVIAPIVFISFFRWIEIYSATKKTRGLGIFAISAISSLYIFASLYLITDFLKPALAVDSRSLFPILFIKWYFNTIIVKSLLIMILFLCFGITFLKKRYVYLGTTLVMLLVLTIGNLYYYFSPFYPNSRVANVAIANYAKALLTPVSKRDKVIIIIDSLPKRFLWQVLFWNRGNNALASISSQPFLWAGSREKKIEIIGDKLKGLPIPYTHILTSSRINLKEPVVLKSKKTTLYKPKGEVEVDSVPIELNK